MNGALTLTQALEWSKTYVSNVAGEIASVIALAMWLTSIPRIRRKMFEVFFYTHYLYILYILFYAIHVGVEYMSMIAPGIFLFLIDRHLRFLQSRQHAPLLSARLLPCGALELNFSKNPSKPLIHIYLFIYLYLNLLLNNKYLSSEYHQYPTKLKNST